jgi:hypothetical protein
MSSNKVVITAMVLKHKVCHLLSSRGVRQALASAESTAYRPTVLGRLGNEIGRIMQQCFPRGTPADTARFMLIGNVLPNRTLADVEIQPRTKMTQCFEERFARLSFEDRALTSALSQQP